MYTQVCCLYTVVLPLFKEHCRFIPHEYLMTVSKCICILDLVFNCRFWILFLQDGVKETGVSLAYTVRQLDAGPVIACEKVEIDDKIKVSWFFLSFPVFPPFSLHYESETYFHSVMLNFCPMLKSNSD